MKKLIFEIRPPQDTSSNGEKTTTSPVRRTLRHEWIRFILLIILALFVLAGYVVLNHNYRHNFEENVDATAT